MLYGFGYCSIIKMVVKIREAPNPYKTSRKPKLMINHIVIVNKAVC